MYRRRIGGGGRGRIGGSSLRGGAGARLPYFADVMEEWCCCEVGGMVRVRLWLAIVRRMEEHRQARPCLRGLGLEVEVV